MKRFNHNTLLMLWSLAAAVGSLSAAFGQSDLILAMSPLGDPFDGAKNALESELTDEFSVTALEVNESTTVAGIGLRIAAAPPRAAVLLGQNSIRLYANYVAARKSETAIMPVVAILAPDVQRETAGIQNVWCIEEETPMVTALISFRRAIGLPIETVGVVYREAYRNFMVKHVEYCKREKFIIQGIMISDNAATRKEELEKALRRLVQKGAVRAQWVPNDKALLTPELIRDVWIPVFAGRKIPVIVGDRALVKPELNFGTYAVVIDLEAMGGQAADLIYNLRNDGWISRGTVIYPAISTYSVLNLRKAVEITDKNKIKTNEVEIIVGIKNK